MKCSHCGDVLTVIDRPCAGCGHPAPDSPEAPPRGEEPAEPAGTLVAESEWPTPPPLLRSPAQLRVTVTVHASYIASCVALEVALLSSVSDTSGAVVALLFLGLWVASGYRFLSWLSTVIEDLQSVLPARSLRLTPRGAVLWFLVPGLNVFHALRVLRILRDQSDPAQLPVAPLQVNEAGGYREPALVTPPAAAPPGVLLGTWSVFWVLSIGMVISIRQGWHGPVPVLLCLSLSALSSALLISILLSLDARLIELHRRALSRYADDNVPAIADRRYVATSALSAASTILVPASALLLSWSGVLPWFKGWLVALTGLVFFVPMDKLLGRWELALRKKLPWGLSLLLLPMMGGLVAMRARTERDEQATQAAAEAYRALLKSISSGEPSVSLAEHLARIERIADQRGTTYTNTYRCMARHQYARAEAHQGLRAAKESESNAATDARRTEAALAQARAWDGLTEQFGPASYDRVIECLESRGGLRDEVISLQAEKQKIDAKMIERYRNNAAQFRAQAEARKVAPAERP